MSTGRSRNSKTRSQGASAATKRRKVAISPAVAADPTVLEAAIPEADWDGLSTTSLTEDIPCTPEKPPPIFKDPNFVHSIKEAAGTKRTRVWKNLKQIVAAERSLPWALEDVTYGSIDAPPSFHPSKRYSDLTGLEAKYVDPQTKLRYTNAEEFSRARVLPPDIVVGLLSLRKANLPVP